jgi:hypothetical protein
MHTPIAATLLKLGLLALFIPACGRNAVAAHDPTPPAVATPPTTVTATAAAPPASPAAPTAAAVTGTAALPSALSIQVDALPPARHTNLRVERLVVARGVVNREPQGTGTLFAADEKRLYAFVEVDNPQHAASDLELQFVDPSGKAQPPVDLAVGESPRWRTWAFTRRAHALGTWKAVVRDDRGHVLASTEFEVT